MGATGGLVMRLLHRIPALMLRLLRARAGMPPAVLRCRACGSPAARCMCVPHGPLLEEPIGDQSQIDTVPENVRAKVVVPSSAPPPPPKPREPHR